MKRLFIESKAFRIAIDEIGQAGLLELLQAEILANPECGDVISGSRRRNKVMSSKVKSRKTVLGQQIIAGLQDALAFEKGQGKNLRTTLVRTPKVPPRWTAKGIASLRHKHALSQPVFAAFLGVSVATVRAWEQGAKVPSGSASRLLQILAAVPNVFQQIDEAA
jgi:putative transcriptional regulator